MFIIEVGELSEKLTQLIDKISSKYDPARIEMEEIQTSGDRFYGSKLVFAIHLRAFGVNKKIESLVESLSDLYRTDPGVFRGSVGGILISAEEEEYTKQTASTLVYRLNKMGLRFVGRPIVEAPVGLQNYLGHSRRTGKALTEILELECFAMLERMERLFLQKNIEQDLRSERQKQIVVLHSSDSSSNTLALWNMVRDKLDDHFSIKEISLKNFALLDCNACGYNACKSFGLNDRCYYRDIMTSEVYPAISNSDIIFLVCPNYNDALSANMTAMINRLTALFRKYKFYDKKLYAAIVSGSSGTESIATQLIRALNMNKTFQLPPYFSISAIANDKGSIFAVEDIETRSEEFAKNILAENI